MVKAQVKYLPVKIKNIPKFKLAYWEIDSEKEGPCLVITAALHGNEVQGSEAIRRFCPIAEKEIVKGRMILVPFANPLALWNRRPHIMSTYEYPKGRMVEKIVDGKKELQREPNDNINRTWPGNPNGNESEQMSYILYNNLIKQATHNIDLHCYNKFCATAAIPENEKEGVEFAKASGFPFINLGASVKKGKDSYPLSDYLNITGVPSFSAEFSGQYIIIDREVEMGVKALINCAKYLGMFKGKLEGIEESLFVENREAVAVRVTAPFSGLFVENGLKTGDYIEEGEILGYLFSDETLETVEIKAPVSGRLFAYGHYRALCDIDLAAMHPYSDKDDLLAVIFKAPKKK